MGLAGVYSNSSSCVWWMVAKNCTGKTMKLTLWCHQTWLAGKSPMNGGFIKNLTDKWSIFQHAIFDYQGTMKDCKIMGS